MKELNLTLSVDDTNKILNALSVQPYKDVNGIILKIQSQANEQLKAKEPTTQEEK